MLTTDILIIIKKTIQDAAQALFFPENPQDLPRVELILNTDKDSSHGDVSTTIALQISKILKKNPRDVATALKDELVKVGTSTPELASLFGSVTLAGPGFLNFSLSGADWTWLLSNIISAPRDFFRPKELTSKRVLIEFVSANPTGPLHLAHGRNAIIGDVLASVFSFVGHQVTREFYINDAGNQINKLGASLRNRYLEQLGIKEAFPEGGYAGEYLIKTAQTLFEQEGNAHENAPAEFFAQYAKTAMLALIKSNLADYGVTFDHFTSEKSMYESGKVAAAVAALSEKGFTYQADGALWLRSTDFGDDKDRVLRKADGDMTYLAPDTAYYFDNFSQGYDKLINILGQDHHGYVTPRNAALKALGCDISKFTCLIYQLVLMKKNDAYVRMSKRAGNFEQLSDVIKIVGRDVARYFFLNRKADAHLELDLEQALKQNDENPVYYIHYAFVRTHSLLQKAADADSQLAAFVKELESQPATTLADMTHIPSTAHNLIKKIATLRSLLEAIEFNNQTHMLAYYAYELAAAFHNFYSHTKIIIPDDIATTKNNLLIVSAVNRTLDLCLELLGLSKPKSM
ncbi:arginine--tRNA ligase [Candidatus Dependentiae bacterium]|nr:arginine--tRNA ligase [Candidatus Dependentiae bacterium]